MQYLKIMKYAILIYGDTKAKIMFFMLFFTYSRYFKCTWSRAGERKDRGECSNCQGLRQVDAYGIGTIGGGGVLVSPSFR